jgi:hypothetical protein
MMPRDGSLTPRDLASKRTVLHVECPKCGCTGRYAIRRLIEQRGRDVRILDWLDELTADCPRKCAASISDQCHARCPDLPKTSVKVDRENAAHCS